MSLNSSQQEAYEKILAFITVSNDRYFILSGGPGTGKSHLINHMMKYLDAEVATLSRVCKGIQARTCVYTATTNSAVDNLAAMNYKLGTKTTQSALKLRVQNGGLVQSVSQNYRDSVLIIDEYTLIDHELFTYIQRSTDKVIFVGDANQLLAVKGLAKELKYRKPDHVLDIPMRTKSEGILTVCNIFLNLVQEKEAEDLVVKDLEDVESISSDAFIALVEDPSFSFTGSRIITHTNAKAIQINQAIRAARGLPEHFIEGERVILNKYVRTKFMSYKTDSEYTIESFLEPDSYIVCDDWGTKHHMPTEDFDLRSMYCSTVYKAQGRSFDTIYIDLDGFPANTSRSVLTRALYVGVSRARSKVVFIGDLSEHLLGKL